jgi:hypothetical protein
MSRFGKTLFFEYPLSNPFNHEERFEIEINDPELRLVTAYEEWHHLRQACRPCVGELGSEPDEAEVFDRDGMGRAQATLLPHETFSLPFTFMTLLPFTPPTKPPTKTNKASNRIRSRSNERKDEYSDYSDRGEGKEGRRDAVSDEEDDDSDNAQRIIEVKIISGSHGHIIAILRIHLHMRSSLVHRVLRFQEYANSIAKRVVKLVTARSLKQQQADLIGDFRKQLKYIHCVETSQILPNHVQSAQESSRVVVEWGAESTLAGDDDAQAMAMMIRYRCGEAPTGGMFYLLIYDDPYQSVLHEVWQVIVYSRLHLDVHSMVRSPSAADLVIRGDQYPRRVRAFSTQSSAYGVAFKPENVFQLVPGAYNRVMTTVQPKVLGNR